MSRFSNLFSAVARPHLLHHLGEDVTRYPLGVVGSAVSGLTGIFNEEEPTKAISSGEEIIRKATLRVADSMTVDLRDAWLVRGERWETTAKPSPVAGFVLLSLQRRDKVSTKRTDGGRLL